MRRRISTFCFAAVASIGMLLVGSYSQTPRAQEQAAAADTGAGTETPQPLSAEEMEVLVARIALYPDELIALIAGASLYPLQIVEAARFLDDYEEDESLTPKDSWDGSVISLLNYPEIVRMMSDDLDWTQALGEVLAYQQQDVLVAIQQLREQAVADGIIKTDDKVEVIEDDDNIVIQSASTETVYVPQYEPEMLYAPDYPPAPIAYYPDPYPHYYYPTATFFAGAVTGAAWAAIVDWDDWGVWGGDWDGGDIDIDCHDCFSGRDFNGKVNINDIDWNKIDRSKIDIDRNQFAKLDRSIKGNIKANSDNSIHNRAARIKGDRTTNLSARTAHVGDVRKSTLEGLKSTPRGAASARPDISNRDIPRPTARPSRPQPSAARSNVRKPASVSRPVGKPKPAARVDSRPRKPSGLGHVSRGKPQKISSVRGHRSMGGGFRGGGGHRMVHRGGRR